MLANRPASAHNREPKRDGAYQEVEWHRRLCVEANAMHEHRETELAAAQADKPRQTADGNAPAKRPAS
jgi:hypothetical protein